MNMAAYERNPVRGTTLEDLDREALAAYLERRLPARFEKFSLEELARQAALLSKSGLELAPTVVGLLIFGELPQLIRPEWGMSAVRVQGKLLSDHVVSRADIEGPIPAMVDEALAFVANYTQSLPEGPEGLTEEYPGAAVREALVNALIHRDWSLSGRVSLRIFNDRLEVWSPGGPPQTALTLEEMGHEGGVSLPRNPLLAATCRALGLGEQLGRGLPVIQREVARSTGHSVSIVVSKADVCLVIPSALQTRMALS